MADIIVGYIDIWLFISEEPGDVIIKKSYILIPRVEGD